MNKEFEKRHQQTLAILKELEAKAKSEGQVLVFLGGSAVQATLKQPRRLSVDLDVHYSGDVSALVLCLEPEYKLEARPTKATDLFSFHKASKEGVVVKIDVARFDLGPKNEKPYEEKTLENGGKKFKANVTTLDYLLGAKLLNTAIGATGRKEFSTQQTFLRTFMTPIV